MVLSSIVEGVRKIMCKHTGEKAWVGKTFHCLDCHAIIPNDEPRHASDPEDPEGRGYYYLPPAPDVEYPSEFEAVTAEWVEAYISSTQLPEHIHGQPVGSWTTYHTLDTGSGNISVSSPLGGHGSAYVGSHMTGTWAQTTDQVQLQREYEKAKKYALAQKMKAAKQTEF